MPKRIEYVHDLDISFEQVQLDQALQVRAVMPSDAEALAELMIDAYRGTIDFDDETLDDARSEIQAFLAGERGGQPLLDLSRVCLENTTVIAACLVGDWDAREQPLISYVMTKAAYKGRGLGRALVIEVLQALQQADYATVRAVITEGNIPSEQIFLGLGFQPV